MKDLFIVYKESSSNSTYLIESLQQLGINRASYRLNRNNYILTNGLTVLDILQIPNNLFEFQQEDYLKPEILNVSEIEIIEISDMILFVHLANVLLNTRKKSYASNSFCWHTCITDGEFEGVQYKIGDMIWYQNSLIRNSVIFRISSFNEVLSQFGKKESDLNKIKITK